MDANLDLFGQATELPVVVERNVLFISIIMNLYSGIFPKFSNRILENLQLLARKEQLSCLLY